MDVFIGLGVPNETVGTLGLDVLVRVRVSAGYDVEEKTDENAISEVPA